MNSTLVKFILLSATSLLMACSTSVKQVIVNPELNIGSSNAYQQKQVQLRVSDMRTASHIVEVSRTDEAAVRYTSQQPFIETVKNTLSSSFKAQGLQIQPLAANQIEVIIDSALVSVQQALIKYSASNQITVRVVIKNTQGSLTKNFKVSGTSTGPLKADLAVLERDFNQQLAKLLTQIVLNKELQQFIQ